jgi:hypothetical protein
MAIEAESVEMIGDCLQLLHMVNVFGKHILVERIARRSMDVKYSFLLMASRTAHQKLIAAFPDQDIPDRGFELAPDPVDAPLSAGSEPYGIGQDCLVVVTQQHDGHCHRQIEAFQGIGTITCGIAETVETFNPMLFSVVDDGPQCLEIAVHIAEYCLHVPGSILSARTGVPEVSAND